MQNSEKKDIPQPKFMITEVPPNIQATAKIIQKKRNRIKIPKQYSDISQPDLIEMLSNSIRFALPNFGIHRPLIWKNRDGWGVTYKILAEVPTTKLKKLIKSSKYDIIQIKWKNHKLSRTGEQLVPLKGYEGAAKPIEPTNTLKFKSLLSS
jgi:hypothetical protein